MTSQSKSLLTLLTILTDRSVKMNGLALGIITYMIATLFAITGMGAAGVLIPTYMMLGVGVYAAMIIALTQNTWELLVASSINLAKKMIEPATTAMYTAVAVSFVPLGYLVHGLLPGLVVLVVFELFLVYALYFTASRRSGGGGGVKAYMLAPLQGFIGGLIGIDAAPIAILAYLMLWGDPKKASANTAITALAVSFTALLLYRGAAVSVYPASLEFLAGHRPCGGFERADGGDAEASPARLDH